MKKINENKIEISPKGSYFETDKEGFLINPTSTEKLQENWKPAIEGLVEACKEHYGEKLKNVYIRGSVAKGEAVENISDLDSFLYVEIEENEINYDWADKVENEISGKYPFINGVEIAIETVQKSEKDYILLNQSLCVYGTPVEIPKLKPGKEMAIHAPAIKNRIEKSLSFLEKEENENKIKNHCVWAMKGILRTGFEITMERSKKYTRDLYKCYETFSEYYPEKEPDMRNVLDLALNPTSNKEIFKDTLEGFGNWLIEETQKYYELK